MKSQHIREVRAFNRFYTNIIGLLDNHILNSNYSLPEARIMFELYQGNGLTASDIIATIHIDKGYLSRILRRFQKSKLITRVSSASDKRAVILELTAKGKKEFEALDLASSRQLETVFKNLPESDCSELVQKMKEIQLILNKTV